LDVKKAKELQTGYKRWGPGMMPAISSDVTQSQRHSGRLTLFAARRKAQH